MKISRILNRRNSNQKILEHYTNSYKFQSKSENYVPSCVKLKLSKFKQLSLYSISRLFIIGLLVKPNKVVFGIFQLCKRNYFEFLTEIAET